MALTTYTELKAAVASYLNRSDLTTQIPDFITLAEADMRRQLRDKLTMSTISLDIGTASKALGSTVKSLISLRYNMTNRLYPLRQMSFNGLASIRVAGSGAPSAFAIADGTAYFDMTPDQAYSLTMVYVEKILPLSGSLASNTTLANSPDIYLFGALKEAAPFLEHDERVTLWEQKYQNAITLENIFRERTESDATPEQQLPVVFGEMD